MLCSRTLSSLIAFIEQLFPSVFFVFIDHLPVKVSLLEVIAFEIKRRALADGLIKVDLLETEGGLLLLD